jgi:hypothetical protein
MKGVCAAEASASLRDPADVERPAGLTARDPWTKINSIKLLYQFFQGKTQLLTR